MTTASTSRLTLASVVLIAILLTVLGILQYRWVGELSEFEGERMRRSLPAAAERLRNDFTRELDNVWRIFSARRGEDVPASFVAAYREWMASAPLPELIDAVFWASAEPDSSELSRFDPRLSRFEASDWPLELGDLRDEFREDRRRSPRGERRRGSYFTPIGTEALALVVTQTDRPTQNRAIVLLNRAVLFERVIPARLREYVAGLSALDYDVWIRDATDAGKIVYSSAPVANLDDLTDVDVAIDLEIPDHLDLEIPDRLDRRSDEAHLLSVFLRHQAGSLEAAVSQIRRRNLLTSLGILALLGATVVVLTVATRRAQDLADQQMAFVAGVSHELRTPITGISSLSQNLADGIVQDSGKTETYGKAIRGARDARSAGGAVGQGVAVAPALRRSPWCRHLAQRAAGCRLGIRRHDVNADG